MHLLDAMTREGFEELVALHDRASGLRAFVGIHDTTRGPAFGGIRRYVYRNEREALLDCLRLSRAMTAKCALADLPAGGAKAVFLDGPGVDVPAAYARLGESVERMGGRFYTGPDVGTGPQELAWLTSRTRFATDPGPAGPGELAESTAEGVFRGIEACLEHLDGEVDWPRRRVVVQGLGAVGAGLAERLTARGAIVLAAEIDDERALEVSARIPLELVDPARAVESACDVYAPCAMGGSLHDVTLPRLRARVVAGAANNVLAHGPHADRLAERGVLYAPDFAINSGALVRGVLFHLEGRREPVAAIGDRIHRTLAEVLERAAAEGLTPARVARRIVQERLARTRGDDADAGASQGGPDEDA